MELESIKPGSKVSYDLFKNITFEGVDDNHVILQDKYGNIKKVYKSLFLKYGKIEKTSSEKVDNYE